MPPISVSSLAVSILPCLGIAWIAHRWASRGGELLYAVARMVVQLLLIGFALIYIFESGNALVGTVVVAIMVSASALISIRLVKQDRALAFTRALLALGLAGGGVLIFTLVAVLQVGDPWYQPRLIVPIAGMVFSNAMTSITLAAERFQNELNTAQTYQQARNTAFTTALIPQINALFAVGLVSLPGMMTGQILSGVDPLIAVRYQIVIMAMVLQASGFSVAIFLWLYRPRTAKN